METKLTKPIIDSISLKDIDAAIDEMINNDKAIALESQIAPTIWCCKWYNSISKEGLTYKKGDAVWINTEDLDSFIASHRQYILNIIENNSTLKLLLKKYENSESKLLEFLKEVVTQPIEGNQWNYPLYYLGNIMKPTQIRVSTCDNNDKLPTDDSCWKDFFIDQNETTIKESIMSATTDICERYLTQHMKDYHLDGIQAHWFDKYSRTGTQLSDEYLLTDMSNISDKQEYQHQMNKVVQGFDFVTVFHQKKLQNNCWKWFRIWNSGLVEHGGVVDVRTAQALGDSLEYSDEGEPMLYEVNLQWEDEDLEAPTYSYVRKNTDLYNDNPIQFSDYTSTKLHNSKDLIDDYNRYMISITPIMNNDTTPYFTQYSSNDATKIQYMSRDVCFITNSSFKFVINENVDRYSYYTSGYVKNIQWSYT